MEQEIANFLRQEEVTVSQLHAIKGAIQAGNFLLQRLKAEEQKAVEFAAGAREDNVTVMHGAAKQEADEVLAAMQAELPDFRLAIEGQITPVLVVHTGPGLVGIGIQRLA